MKGRPLDILNTPLGQLGIVGVLLVACGLLFGIIIRTQSKNAADALSAKQVEYDNMVKLKDTEYANMVDVKNGLITAANGRGDEWLKAARDVQAGRDRDREVLAEQLEAMGRQLQKFTSLLDPSIKIPTIYPRTGHNVDGEVDHVGA